MRRHRDSREVVDGESTVGFDWTTEVACHEPDELRSSTEVRAVKECRDPDTETAPIIFHARKTIDQDFGVRRRGRCRRRLDECKRGGCDDPVNSLHDYLPRWCGAGVP